MFSTLASDYEFEEYFILLSLDKGKQEGRSARFDLASTTLAMQGCLIGANRKATPGQMQSLFHASSVLEMPRIRSAYVEILLTTIAAAKAEDKEGFARQIEKLKEFLRRNMIFFGNPPAVEDLIATLQAVQQKPLPIATPRETQGSNAEAISPTISRNQDKAGGESTEKSVNPIVFLFVAVVVILASVMLLQTCHQQSNQSNKSTNGNVPSFVQSKSTEESAQPSTTADLREVIVRHLDEHVVLAQQEYERYEKDVDLSSKQPIEPAIAELLESYDSEKMEGAFTLPASEKEPPEVIRVRHYSTLEIPDVSHSRVVFLTSAPVYPNSLCRNCRVILLAVLMQYDGFGKLQWHSPLLKIGGFGHYNQFQHAPILVGTREGIFIGIPDDVDETDAYRIKLALYSLDGPLLSYEGYLTFMKSGEKCKKDASAFKKENVKPESGACDYVANIPRWNSITYKGAFLSFVQAGYFHDATTGRMCYVSRYIEINKNNEMTFVEDGANSIVIPTEKKDFFFPAHFHHDSLEVFDWWRKNETKEQEVPSEPVRPKADEYTREASLAVAEVNVSGQIIAAQGF